MLIKTVTTRIRQIADIVLYKVPELPRFGSADLFKLQRSEAERREDGDWEYKLPRQFRF